MFTTALEVALLVVLLDTFEVTDPASWWENYLDCASVQAATLTAADSTLWRRVKKHLAFRQRVEQD